MSVQVELFKQTLASVRLRGASSKISSSMVSQPEVVLQLPSSTSKALGTAASYWYDEFVVPSHISPGAHLVHIINIILEKIILIIEFGGYNKGKVT